MILVFGKTGQVASELRKLSVVKCLDRQMSNLIIPENCIEAIFRYRPIAVINAAAYTYVDRAEIDEDLANLINGDSPGAMAKACAQLNIPLLHISTDYVFDGSGARAWRTYDVTSPQNAYGRSKLRGEEAIRSSGCNYVILRTSWVVSEHGNNFVKKMLHLSETKDSLKVVDDQVGGPTFACDLAAACIEMVRQLIKEPKKSGIYHFSGMPDVSWCQFASTIFKKAGRKTVVKPILTSEYKTPALRPLNSRLNCELTETTFDIARPYWLKGLANGIEVLRISHEKS